MVHIISIRENPMCCTFSFSFCSCFLCFYFSNNPFILFMSFCSDDAKLNFFFNALCKLNAILWHSFTTSFYYYLSSWISFLLLCNINYFLFCFLSTLMTHFFALCLWLLANFLFSLVIFIIFFAAHIILIVSYLIFQHFNLLIFNFLVIIHFCIISLLLLCLHSLC